MENMTAFKVLMDMGLIVELGGEIMVPLHIARSQDEANNMIESAYRNVIDAMKHKVKESDVVQFTSENEKVTFGKKEEETGNMLIRGKLVVFNPSDFEIFLDKYRKEILSGVSIS